MLRPIDEWYLNKDEPIKSCLQFLRQHILQQDKQLSEAWKYGMPFFCYNGKMVCYFWIHKKLLQPYIGIVEGKKMKHPDLIQEKRARMKILLLDPTRDLPMRKINQILKEMLSLYK
ncbi:MAG: DUF1801 domain-containing protein [Chitinophagaceae bacterium]